MCVCAMLYGFSLIQQIFPNSGLSNHVCPLLIRGMWVCVCVCKCLQLNISIGCSILLGNPKYWFTRTIMALSSAARTHRQMLIHNMPCPLSCKANFLGLISKQCKSHIIMYNTLPKNQILNFFLIIIATWIFIYCSKSNKRLLLRW